MSRRDTFLALILVLIGGILIGLFAAGAFEDDGESASPAETSAYPTTPVDSSTAPAAYPTTPVDTTATTGPALTSTSEAAPATTTTAAINDVPAADATTGEIVGFPPGAAPQDVLAAVTARFGEPTNDTGWNGGCPLDGGPDDHERIVAFGTLRLRFDRWDQPEQLAGWSYLEGAASGPTPDDLVLHPNVVWGQPIDEVAAATGADRTPDETFGITFVQIGDTSYRATGLEPTIPLDYVGWMPSDICE